MKKGIFLMLPLLVALCSLTGCATAITAAKSVEPYEVSSSGQTKNMEYIGLKIDRGILGTTTDSYSGYNEYEYATNVSESPTVKKIGHNLEEANVAIDKSYAYFGVYSLQEIATYKYTNRYVTFVEVEKINLKFTDTGTKQQSLGISGGALAGGGGAMMILGGICMPLLPAMGGTYLAIGGAMALVGGVMGMIALQPSKTTTQLDAVYNVYIYDCVRKEILRKEPVTIKRSDEFKGSFTYDDDSKKVVWDYYGAIVTNALLEKYEELGRWIHTL